MITLYLRRVAAKRAYSAAQGRDLKAWKAYCAVPGGYPTPRDKAAAGRVCDVTQGRVTDAWRRLREASEAWYAALEVL